MFAVQDPTTGAIIISIVVGVFGTIQVLLARKTGKEAATAVKEVQVETKKVADATTTASTTSTELLLAKHDQILTKVTALGETVEHNRQQNHREHLENQERIAQVAEGQATLFDLLVELDKKVTPKVRVKAPKIEVDVVSMPGAK